MPSLPQCLTASVVNLSGTRSLRGAGVRDAQGGNHPCTSFQGWRRCRQRKLNHRGSEAQRYRGSPRDCAPLSREFLARVPPRSVVAQEERAQANLERRDVLSGTPSLPQCLTASVVNLSGTRSLRGAGVRDPVFRCTEMLPPFDQTAHANGAATLMTDMRFLVVPLAKGA